VIVELESKIVEKLRSFGLKRIVLWNGDDTEGLLKTLTEPSVLLKYEGESGQVENRRLLRQVDFSLYLVTLKVANNENERKKAYGLIDEILDSLKRLNLSKYSVREFGTDERRIFRKINLTFLGG
jgi:ribosome-associated translation inhibitor RaiA